MDWGSEQSDIDDDADDDRKNARLFSPDDCWNSDPKNLHSP